MFVDKSELYIPLLHSFYYDKNNKLHYNCIAITQKETGLSNKQKNILPLACNISRMLSKQNSSFPSLDTKISE